MNIDNILIYEYNNDLCNKNIFNKKIYFCKKHIVRFSQNTPEFPVQNPKKGMHHCEIKMHMK